MGFKVIVKHNAGTRDLRYTIGGALAVTGTNTALTIQNALTEETRQMAFEAPRPHCSQCNGYGSTRQGAMTDHLIRSTGA